MKKLAIIGASYLQEPLIQKAKSMGIETHVFAWAVDDVGEKSADYFYPISIVEKETILHKCREIGINGICSIASDLAMVTVNYVAERLGLVGNSTRCTENSTNKHKMRQCFEQNGDPSPKSILVDEIDNLQDLALSYPVIVKPTDRSGSRGITKLENNDGLLDAIVRAKKLSIEGCALIEEYAEGQEYSVECISWEGEHSFLAMTRKYTTGAPSFIETGHLQPASVTEDCLKKVKAVVFHALDSLEIKNGASHSELKITADGKITLIEIGGRMGGDFIGSDLVYLSTGFDFVKAVIEIALGKEPSGVKKPSRAAAVRFVVGPEDIAVFRRIQEEHPELIVQQDVSEHFDHLVVDSASRFGYYLLKSYNSELLQKYMPD